MFSVAHPLHLLRRKRRRARSVRWMDEAEWMDGREIGSLSLVIPKLTTYIGRHAEGLSLRQTVHGLLETWMGVIQNLRKMGVMVK